MDLLTTNQSETSADIELELEYEIEEDIEAELENFVRLNHTGQFEDAHELFDQCLSSHDDWYPIAAEYADCLLREGKFKQLADFSRKASMTFQEPGEKTLLLLMEMIGKRAPRDIMRQQLQALWPADVFKPPYTSIKDTDIHIKEIVLLALVLTRPNQVLGVSLTPDSTSVGPWNAAKDLFYYLLHNQLFWEAQRVLQSLLHIVSLDESQTMVHDYIREAVSTNIGEESAQIAVSSLIQRFIYVAESRWSNPLAVVPWNDAITWALLGSTLAKTNKDTTSPFICITLRRSLQEKLGITLPLDSERGNDEMSDSLYEAVKNGDVSMMRQAMTVSRTRYGWDEVKSTVLPIVAQHCSEKEVLVFLDSDTVDARDGYQRTALHWAAIKGDRPTIRTLLFAGAGPGSLDWFGLTPLHYAVKISSFAQYEVAFFEQDEAASFEQDEAASFEQDEAASFKQDQAAFFEHYEAAFFEHYEAAILILRVHASTVNTKDLSGLGPLHMALLDDDNYTADLVIKHGAILETDEINPLPPFDSGNVDWDHKARAYSTSDPASPKFRGLLLPMDTLTGAKHGALSKRLRSSISDGADLSRSHSRERSSSDQLGLRTSRSRLSVYLWTAPKSPKPNPSITLPGQHTSPIYPPNDTPDQNPPPSNTLYVGNLPADTSRDELKDLSSIFRKQRGYKKFYLKRKQNGPMCFVEFEGVAFATKALNELHGHSLHNSAKGGIRLSFAKIPLENRAGTVEAKGALTRPL
ncbi:hypothetical protein BDR22DRAFT_892203 [Usnea florida]